jgi:predicted permease
MTLVQDIRYAARVLRRTPAFTVTAALSLAIGIAGHVVVFSIADAVLLRDQPGLTDSGRLVDVGRTQSGGGFDTVSYPNYLDYRSRTRTLASLAAYRDGEPFALTTDRGDAIRVFGGQVSANYFDTLGVRMALGRGFVADEERVGDPRLVVVLSEPLWRSAFHADPTTIGRTVRINGRPHTIVGVTRNGFAGNSLAREALWLPLTTFPEGGDMGRLTRREGTWLMMIGRLRPEATVAQARTDLERITRDLEREYPDANRGRGVAVARHALLPPPFLRVAGGFIGVLFGFVLLILAIACTNIGGMLLARGYARAREVAVRLAIGGSRALVIRQLAIESVLLASSGAVAGVALGWAGIRAVRSVIPVLPLDLALDLGLDARAVLFALAVALAAGTACGLVPAWQTVRANLLTAIRGDEATTPRRLRLRHALLTAQIAMSVLLLIAALLLARSLRAATSINTGFDADNVDVVALSLQLGNYDPATGRRLVDDVLGRIQNVQGVQEASASVVVPLMMEDVSLGSLWSRVPTTEPTRLSAGWNMVTPRYFDTLRIPILRGRAFTTSDVAVSPAVAIVNETFARRAWPDREAVGQTLLHGESPTTATPIVVVGVARDAKYQSLGEDPRPFIYVPLAQRYRNDLSLMVRHSGGSVIPAIRSILRERDPDLPVIQTTTLAAAASVGLTPYRVIAWLASSVAVIAILLAAIGIYGVTAFNITLRTKELGVRVALGAQSGQVLRLVMRRSLAVASIGSLIGAGAAALATQVLGGFLFGIRPLDVPSFGAAIAALLSMAVLASLFPARRAARVDPVIALRAE